MAIGFTYTYEDAVQILKRDLIKSMPDLEKDHPDFTIKIAAEGEYTFYEDGSFTHNTQEEEALECLDSDCECCKCDWFEGEEVNE